MTRITLPLAALFGCLFSVSALGADVRRPNILFLFADDWGRHAQIYAEDRRPGRRQRRGADAAFRPTGASRRAVPQRARQRTVLHALPQRAAVRPVFLADRPGGYSAGRGLGFVDPLVSAAVERAGYHIGKTYKVWSPGTPPDAPYGGQQFAYEKAGRRFNQFSQHVTRMVADGKPVGEAKQVLYDEVLGNFRAFLADRQADQPFCYWFGPTNVHRKWIKGSGKALWGLDPDDLKGKMPPFLPDVHEVREDLVDYFGEIMAFDAAIGLLLDEVKRAGEWDNTLVVISGDHGAPGFPHGKCNLYDFGTGVCLAIAGPGVRGGRVVDDFVNLTDLAPTFLEAGGVAVPEVMTGRSLWPVLKSDRQGLVDPQRDFRGDRPGTPRRDGSRRSPALPATGDPDGRLCC
jgi:N-sulfoglucosamine sulfohydrolase